MRIIKYKTVARVDTGNGKYPVYENVFSDVEISWSKSNEEIARREAYNGEYTIVDDGQPEPEPKQSPEERIRELEEALEMLLSGVTE